MLITGILIFLLLSALFSGTEIAFVSASKLRVELKKLKGSRKGTILANFYDDPAKFIGTMLVGNNIALVLFSILMQDLLSPFFSSFISGAGWLLLVNTIIITIVILIFGEFLPKTFFRLYANDILYFLVYPLNFLIWLLAIPSWVMTKLSNLLLRVFFKMPAAETRNVLTRLDLETFIRGTRLEDSEEEIDTDYFAKALHLRNVKVRECMVHRTEIEDVDVNDDVGDLRQLFTDTNLSRLVVSKDGIDNVLGYVHHQQLFNKPKSIRELVMDIPFVPEAMRVRDLLNEFIKRRINIACVVDEYGGTSGIITMEDILEEIFGEIEDEHDSEDYVENKIADGEYIFSGRLEIAYLNDKYEELNLPEGDYSTLSGYLVLTTETIPEQGAEIELDGYKYILELVSETKIETVRLIKLQPNDEKVAK